MKQNNLFNGLKFWNYSKSIASRHVENFDKEPLRRDIHLAELRCEKTLTMPLEFFKEHLELVEEKQCYENELKGQIDHYARQMELIQDILEKDGLKKDEIIHLVYLASNDSINLTSEIDERLRLFRKNNREAEEIVKKGLGIK